MRVATYARRIPPLQASGDGAWQGLHRSLTPGRRRKASDAQGVGRDRGGGGGGASSVRDHANRLVDPTSPPNSNAKHEQADQARPHRRQPRLISRYVGTRKPTRRRATCLTIQRSALASLSCAWLARAWRPTSWRPPSSRRFFAAPFRVAFLARPRALLRGGFLHRPFARGLLGDDLAGGLLRGLLGGGLLRRFLGSSFRHLSRPS